MELVHFPVTTLDHIRKQHTSCVSHTLLNVSHADLCFHLKNITWVGFVYTGWKYVLKPSRQPQVLETGRKGNSCYDAKVHICSKTLARKPSEKSRLIHALHPHQMTSDRVTPTFLQKPNPDGMLAPSWTADACRAAPETTVLGPCKFFLCKLNVYCCAALKRNFL